MLVQRLQLPPGRKAPHTHLFLIKGLLKTELNALYTDPSFLLPSPLCTGFVEDANPAGEQERVNYAVRRRQGRAWHTYV